MLPRKFLGTYPH
ncbi:hypothetical protein CPC197_0809A, partial [Chlamydia psittaci C1/97]